MVEIIKRFLKRSTTKTFEQNVKNTLGIVPKNMGIYYTALSHRSVKDSPEENNERLEDLLVTESLRGKGVGKLLFEAVMEETKNRGFKRMCWQVLDWNEPAINFYKKFGAKLDPEWMNGLIDF